MDLEKLNYNEQDIKNMAINAADLRNRLQARDLSAFDEVSMRCSDLEKCSPEMAGELKRRSQAQKQKYKKTQDPACFAQLVRDVEELYGRAFKLMIENIRSLTKTKNEKSTAEIVKNAATFQPIANTLEGATHDRDAQKHIVEDKAEAVVNQEKKRGGLFGRKEKPDVRKISLKDLEDAQMDEGQDEKQNPNGESTEEVERRRAYEEYNKRVQERAAKNKTQQTMSSSGLGMEYGKRKN